MPVLVCAHTAAAARRYLRVPMLDSRLGSAYTPKHLRTTHGFSSPNPSRHARSLDPQGGFSRPSARIWCSAPDRTDFEWRARHRARRALSRPVPFGSPGIAEGEVGHVGEQPARKIL